MTLAIFLFSHPGFARSPQQLPIIAGKIQGYANCIQCGGRFICGYTEETVKLRYLRSYKKQTVANHCAQKSHDIKESVRVNDGPRTEESVRWEEYYSSILKKIQENKGGNLKYKEEKGFPYSDFYRYTEKLSGKSKKQQKALINKSKKQLKQLEEDHVVLPIVSIQDFDDYLGDRENKRLDIEYVEYVKNLLTLHPSELEESSIGTGIFIKAIVPNKNLKEKMSAQFGSRAMGGKNNASGGGGGGSSTKGSGSEGKQKRGTASLSTSSVSDSAIYDDNGMIINSKLRADEKAKQKAINSAALLKEARLEIGKSNQRRRNWAKAAARNGSSAYYRPNSTTYDYMSEIYRSKGDSLCAGGNNQQNAQYGREMSRSIASTWGNADSNLGQSVISEDLNNTIQNALNASSQQNCQITLKSIFEDDTPNLVSEAKVSADEVEVQVAKDEAREKRYQRYIASSTDETTPPKRDKPRSRPETDETPEGPQITLTAANNPVSGTDALVTGQAIAMKNGINGMGQSSGKTNQSARPGKTRRQGTQTLPVSFGLIEERQNNNFSSGVTNYSVRDSCDKFKGETPLLPILELLENNTLCSHQEIVSRCSQGIQHNISNSCEDLYLKRYFPNIESNFSAVEAKLEEAEWSDDEKQKLKIRKAHRLLTNKFKEAQKDSKKFCQSLSDAHNVSAKSLNNAFGDSNGSSFSSFVENNPESLIDKIRSSYSMLDEIPSKLSSSDIKRFIKASFDQKRKEATPNFCRMYEAAIRSPSDINDSSWKLEKTSQTISGPTRDLFYALFKDDLGNERKKYNGLSLTKKKFYKIKCSKINKMANSKLKDLNQLSENIDKMEQLLSKEESDFNYVMKNEFLVKEAKILSNQILYSALAEKDKVYTIDDNEKSIWGKSIKDIGIIKDLKVSCTDSPSRLPTSNTDSN